MGGSIKKAKFVNRLITTTTIQDQAIIHAIIDEVIKLPVSNRKTYIGNYIVIKEECKKESEWLISELRANDKELFLREFETFLRKIQNNLAKYFFLTKIDSLTDDEKEIVSRVIEGMLRIANKNKHSFSGLFQSCIDFDAWTQETAASTSPLATTCIPSYASEIKYSRSNTILETACNTVFQETILFINSKIEDPNIKASLRKFFLLHSAMASVVPKAAAEGNNAISRFVQKVVGEYP